LFSQLLDSTKSEMKSVYYFKATEADIQTLVDFRIEFIVELSGLQTDEQTALLRKHLGNYFSYAIKQKLYICWIAKSENNIVGIGGMSIREQPGNFRNPSGKSGYIMNMYTVPGFRRKGICSTLLKKLMETAKEMGIEAFELHATKDGEPVYEKNGFQIHNQPTYRKYGFDNAESI
jgi:ribosomal protein S18 acetylase RimI-like enzyme